MARRKTRAEKIASTYRLKNFRLEGEGRRARGLDFEYISAGYVKKDLTKTIVFSLMILVLEMVLARVY